MDQRSVTFWKVYVCFLLFSAHCLGDDRTTDSVAAQEVTTISKTSTEDKKASKCKIDSDCVVTGQNVSIPHICDTQLGKCICPLTNDVIEQNGTCHISTSQRSQRQPACNKDEDCSGWMGGSVCIVQNATGKCSCPNEMPEGHAHVTGTSCPLGAVTTAWNELITLKWLFIFMIMGYPVITLIFVIFQKERDDHWFFEKIGSFLSWAKLETPTKRRMKQNRRNTQDELVSTDDEESPLEMEFV